MTVDQLLAKYGAQCLELDDRKAQYAALLDRFAAVIGGQLDPSRVIVNLTDQTWAVTDVGVSPALPATINGLPVCVVAPPPQQQAGFHDDKGEVIVTGRNLVIIRIEAAEDAANLHEQHEAA